MEKAKKRIFICLLCVVIIAVIVGILYYYHGLGENQMQAEGTLVSASYMGWMKLCQ